MYPIARNGSNIPILIDYLHRCYSILFYHTRRCKYEGDCDAAAAAEGDESVTKVKLEGSTNTYGQEVEVKNVISLPLSLQNLHEQSYKYTPSRIPDNTKPYLLRCAKDPLIGFNPIQSAMGILSWFTRSNNNNVKKDDNSKTSSKPAAKPEFAEVAGMNGAVEVRRPDPPTADISVFEFGSIAASADKVTLAGYCPVSDELEPCRWEILPASGEDAPQFRVVF